MINKRCLVTLLFIFTNMALVVANVLEAAVETVDSSGDVGNIPL